MRGDAADQERCTKTFMEWLAYRGLLETITDDECERLADAFSSGWILATGGVIPGKDTPCG